MSNRFGAGGWLQILQQGLAPSFQVYLSQIQFEYLNCPCSPGEGTSRTLARGSKLSGATLGQQQLKHTSVSFPLHKAVLYYFPPQVLYSTTSCSETSEVLPSKTGEGNLLFVLFSLLILGCGEGAMPQSKSRLGSHSFSQ